MIQKLQDSTQKYVFIGKSLFFPKEKILVIGDLHLGYDAFLREKSIEIPLKQFEDVCEELEKITKYITVLYGKIKKIIFLGDIKHHFGFLITEREEIKKLLAFLKKFEIDEEQIIFIRGNHEKNEKDKSYRDFYIDGDIAFIHGHKNFPEIYNKKINLIVMSHIHPSIILRDELKIRAEKYKCFLVGKYKKKKVVIVPSFVSLIEGALPLEYENTETEREASFSIIPQKDLEDFGVFVVSEVGEEALKFGKLKELE